MRLKPGPIRTDSVDMFTCGPDAHAFSPAALAGLRVCLNAPVLNTAELPVGPAKAAIVLYAEDYGNLCLGIAVRSLESGQLAFYTWRGTIDETLAPEQIMAPALTLSEGMGFLFDDDMMAPGTEKARALAYEAWMDLVGELEETLSEELVLDEIELSDAADDPDLDLEFGSADSLELVLEEQLEDDFDDDDLDEAMLAEAAEALEPRVQPAERAPVKDRPRAKARPSRPAAGLESAALSKFRGGPGTRSRPAAAAAAGADGPGEGAPARKRQVVRTKDGAAALGKVPIVKVRRGGANGGEEAPGFLARVLGGF